MKPQILIDAEKNWPEDEAARAHEIYAARAALARAEQARKRREFAYCAFSVARLDLSGFGAVESPAEQVNKLSV